jgi:hypothetical protein
MQRVSPQDAAEFHRVLAADDGTWLYKTLDTYYKGDEEKKKGFFKTITEKLFGKPKGPLDMTPDELARLTRLTYDAKNDTEISVSIQPEDLVEDAKGKSASDMKFIVDKFYNNNSRYFSSPDNIDFDEDSWTLTYKGRTRLAKKLLKEMGVSENVIKETVKKKKGGILNLHIEVGQLVDENDFGDIDLGVLKQLRTEMRAACGNKVHVDFDYSDKDPVGNAIKDSPHSVAPEFGEEKNGVLVERSPGYYNTPKDKQVFTPWFELRGSKMDIYEGLKKCKSLDQHKVKEIFEGDLRNFIKK